MDLGYGSKNQTVGNVAAAAIIRSAKAQEEAIHAEIDRYDALLESTDSELELLREKRLEQMKRFQLKKQEWRSLGHGVYSSLGEGQHGGDTAKEFFDAAKVSERMVVHFHRSSTRLCDVFHAHLEKLAPMHLETRFLKINVDKISVDGASGSGVAYLVEKLGVVIMPTLVIVKDRQVIHHIRGFDELGGTENFSVDALEWVLGAHGAINKGEGKEMPEELQRAYKGVNGVTIKRRYAGGTRGGVKVNSADDDYDDD